MSACLPSFSKTSIISGVAAEPFSPHTRLVSSSNDSPSCAGGEGGHSAQGSDIQCGATVGCPRAALCCMRETTRDFVKRLADLRSRTRCSFSTSARRAGLGAPVCRRFLLYIFKCLRGEPFHFCGFLPCTRSNGGPDTCSGAQGGSWLLSCFRSGAPPHHRPPPPPVPLPSWTWRSPCLPSA
jgi:hypothetical protein